MGQKRRVVQLIGGACVALAALALTWPGEPAGVVGGQECGYASELDMLLAASRRKQELKAAVYDEVIAGRLPLTAAVERCEGIEGQFPELAETFRVCLRACQPGRTFRERLAHCIVA